MAFGRAAGPPASHQQMQELVELLERAGHEDFRDARGPMGFTQRQAGGKFTRDEAQAFIDQLLEAEEREAEGAAASRASSAAPKPAAASPKLSKAERALRELRSEDLAAELERRGFDVTKR